MKKLGQIMSIGLGFAVLVAILPSNFNKTATAEKVDPVLVTNTAAQAVPTIAAQNGAWNVGIIGTPTVNVGNTPTVNLGSGATVGINGSVQIGNTATSPVQASNVDNPARHPFQVNLCASFITPTCGSNNTFFNVPSGTELVIEYVSDECFTGPGDAFQGLELGTFVQGIKVTHFFSDPSTGPLSLTKFGEQTRIYADPGTAVEVTVIQGAGTGSSCSVSISGSLISVP